MNFRICGSQKILVVTIFCLPRTTSSYLLLARAGARPHPCQKLDGRHVPPRQKTMKEEERRDQHRQYGSQRRAARQQDLRDAGKISRIGWVAEEQSPYTPIKQIQRQTGVQQKQKEILVVAQPDRVPGIPGVPECSLITPPNSPTKIHHFSSIVLCV